MIINYPLLSLLAKSTVLLGLLAVTACSVPPDQDPAISAATGGESDPRIVPVTNYQQALELFEELNYTSEAWQAGIRVVPRVYLSEITDRWSKVTTKEIDVALKKRLFFRAIGPLVLRSNELILGDRERLQTIVNDQAYADENNQAWLQTLGEDYGLSAEDFVDTETFTRMLLERVDIIPPSLVLAQAAEESGWGTSRFAFTGNALFGQWTWDGDGMRPEQQRSSKGDHRIASFDAPLQSVRAHARNLNSHFAYTEFRAMRTQLRRDKKRISGHVLAQTLEKYSERGAGYVKSLRDIMSYNKLDPADDAYLGDNQPIVLVNAVSEE
jgi:Bax protein